MLRELQHFRYFDRSITRGIRCLAMNLYLLLRRGMRCFASFGIIFPAKRNFLSLIRSETVVTLFNLLVHSRNMLPRDAELEFVFVSRNEFLRELS
jgi:hypothetical protein